MKRADAIGLGCGFVKIIEKDEVKIRGRRHLARTKLAQRQHDHLASWHCTMVLRKCDAHMLKTGADNAGRERGIGVARVDRINRGREQPHADQENFFERKITNGIEKIFG